MTDKVFGIKSSILLLVIIYLGFISLGLPDAVLGVAWDYMRIDFSRPVQYAGFISMLLTCCSAVSSFCSGAILKRVSVGRLLAICGFVTGVSLLGYSLSPAFWVVLLLAIPLGFGQGAVDTGMNYYVAANYSSSQMNWLHCCWGIGAGTGPLLTTWLIASGSSWRWGYGVIAAVQITLALMFAFSNRMWQRSAGDKGNLNHKTTVESASYSRGRFYSCVVMMWLYTGIESSVGLWGYMYLTLCAGTAADVAGYTMAGYCGRAFCDWLFCQPPRQYTSDSLGAFRRYSWRGYIAFRNAAAVGYRHGNDWICFSADLSGNDACCSGKVQSCCGRETHRVSGWCCHARRCLYSTGIRLACRTYHIYAAAVSGDGCRRFDAGASVYG